MALSLRVVQAFDRQIIKEIPQDDLDSLEKKILLAETIFKNRENSLKPHVRILILRKTARLVDANRDELATLIAREGGKPIVDAVVEVTRAIDGINDAADELRTFSGREIPMGLTQACDQRFAFTTREPIGIVAALSAFNHPLNLIVHQVFPAVAVGCPVIIKPAASTPLSCLKLVELLYEAGLPEGLCQTLITDDNRVAEKLATDPRIGFLSFIGSAKVGWYLRSKIAPGVRCALEHGGAAPLILDASADLNPAVESITKGGYYHAGQVCVSVQRIFVQESISEEFVSLFSKRIQALKTGDPLNSETEVGPLIHPRETLRVESWIKEALDEKTIQIGGGRLSETTLKPAILLNPKAHLKVSQLEIFGPVTCVYAYREIDQAIEIANSLPFAFQASIFSKNVETAMRAARRLDASAILINDHTAFRTDWMPFAGRKQSGYGTGGIPYSMKDMTEEKMIVLRYS